MSTPYNRRAAPAQYDKGWVDQETQFIQRAIASAQSPALTNSSAALTTGITLSTTGTDILALSLAAATWLLFGTFVLSDAGLNASSATFWITDGTNPIVKGAWNQGSTNGGVVAGAEMTVTLVAVVTLSASTTVRMRGTSSLNATAVGAASATSARCSFAAVQIG